MTMKHYYLIVTFLWIITTNALVHYEKLEAGSNGCKGVSGKDIPVGGSEKDPNVCGVYVCQNTKGDALIHYCQQPAAFQDCETSGVSTITDFPQCCWLCVTFVDCDYTRPDDQTNQEQTSTEAIKTAISFMQKHEDPDEVAQYKAFRASLC